MYYTNNHKKVEIRWIGRFQIALFLAVAYLITFNWIALQLLLVYKNFQGSVLSFTTTNTNNGYWHGTWGLKSYINQLGSGWSEVSHIHLCFSSMSEIQLGTLKWVICVSCCKRKTSLEHPKGLRITINVNVKLRKVSQ